MDATNYREMLAEAEAEIERAKQAAQDAESVARFCRQKLAQLAQQTLPIRFDRSIPSLVGRSVPDAVKEVLQISERPMRAGEIASALVKAGFQNKKSLSVTVTSAIRRRDDLFQKVARGLFALRDGDIQK